MALAIMCYHFVGWSSEAPDGNSVLGRLGIYGVSIFYILSGMSLYVAYSNISWSRSELLTFWKRRLLRIAPLYWIACIGVLVLLKGYRNQPLETILGNLTLTFGFLDYTHYIPTGGWSIGNEICFYLIFPVLIISSKNIYLFTILCGALFAAYLQFAFSFLSKDSTLALQWKLYIHPLNQAFLFAGGIILAKASAHAHHLTLPRLAYVALLALSLSGLFLFENTPNAIDLVTSTNRLIFTAFSLAACYACFNLNATGKNWLEKALKHLGEISYSVYMLHGLLFVYMQKHLYKGFVKNLTLSQFAFFIVAPIVLIAATYCYYKIEKPFIRFGKITSGPFKDRLRTAFSQPSNPAN
ncbi:Peptidoglycan/LPS O-acetylase OafA/YrhL, contains acyltransferase and SGNH-hydrolase domains [Pseudomonas sp. NFACC09-4]|nr:Peptidoglycan/LPS O-acetylase OafA/YrhL, contains acyltransferase and SGNH-hydrolase domains [Pseudomonas sp. NFACC09-4]